MKIPDIENLIAEAKATRKQKMDAANREYAEEVRHIRWLRNRVSGNRSALTKHKDAPAEVSNGNGQDSLMSCIRAAAIHLNQFTADDVIKWLETEYPHLDAGTRRVVLASNLSRMGGKGLLETVMRGARGRLQVYRVTEKLKEATA